MTRTEINTRVQKVCAEELGIELSRIVPEAHIEEDFGADSLDMVELCMALEEEFQIELEDEKVEKVKTIQQLIELVSSKLQTV